mgnify:CR=1 FL=1
MGEIGYPVHALALNLLHGPNYGGMVEQVDTSAARSIIIRIPFPTDFPDDVMARLLEEIATGLYLPRSEATRGLMEKGTTDGPIPKP